MHLGAVNYEQQYQLHDATGAVIWRGTVIYGIPYLVENVGATAISPGMLVAPDGPNSTFGRDQNPGTSDPDVNAFRGVIAPASNTTGILGVAVDPIPATTGRGLVAGPGSVTTVRCTSAAIAVGTPIVTSGTAGLGLAAGTKSATVPAYGTVAGQCIKANAQIGSTGLYAAGILVGGFGS